MVFPVVRVLKETEFNVLSYVQAGWDAHITPLGGGSFTQCIPAASGSVASLCITCSALVEGLRHESVGCGLPHSKQPELIFRREARFGFPFGYILLLRSKITRE